MAAGDTITVEKLVVVYTSRDVAAASVRPACLDDSAAMPRPDF